jgi:hypothetical protein
MRKIKAAFLIPAIFLLGAITVSAQGYMPGQPMVPLGSCQLSATQLSAAIGLSSCVRASFTGSGSGTNLTTTSVTGIIKAGDAVSGSGVPAGTTIVSQTSGTAGGAGVYVTSNATTSSSASLTSGGIPPGATMAVLQAETANVRYRDDGGAPTSGIGSLVVNGAFPPILYTGTLTALQFIAASGSPLLDVAFYR